MRHLPTPPARPHFTHHEIGDLLIVAGLAADAPPMHGLYRPTSPQAWAASLAALEEISDVDPCDEDDFEPPTVGGEVV